MPVIGLIAAGTGLVAQILKAILASAKARRPRFDQLFATGGMPSSHTAAVTVLTLLVAERDGVASPIFSVTLIFSLYVVFEATGLRQEVGKQARVLNDLVDVLLTTRTLDVRRLRELTGHTWAEVGGGVLCGLAAYWCVRWLRAG